jgi:hypothetical protein
MDPEAAVRCSNSIVRSLFAGVVAASALVALPSAGAKDFKPGDVRICGAKRCAAIVNRTVLPRLASFYYSGPRPPRVRGPAIRAPYYELRFRNGYVTGIVATRRLDRFLSYGVVLERFARGRWHALPRRLSVELQRLTLGLRPLRLTRGSLARSR